MINLVIKQRIILAHIDGMSNRAIANVLHLSKDTVNKYVNEYNEKREELLRMHPDMDTSEIIQAFIEKPTYDSSNRIPSKATPELDILVRRSRQSGVARATNPDFESHRLLLILLVLDLNHILLA